MSNNVYYIERAEDFKALADVIRLKTGTTEPMQTSNMADAIRSMASLEGSSLFCDMVGLLNWGRGVSITAEDLAGVTKLRDYAFWGKLNQGGSYSDPKYPSVEFPEGLKHIGSYIFDSTAAISAPVENIPALPSTVETISDYSFYCVDRPAVDNKYVFPASVKKIGDFAFYNAFRDLSFDGVHIYFNGLPSDVGKNAFGRPGETLTTKYIFHVPVRYDSEMPYSLWFAMYNCTSYEIKYGYKPQS